MKKIAIMQPYFFPYIGYWQLINLADKFVLLDDVNFIKKGWIHKNLIMNNNETRQINICISKMSQNKQINDLSLSTEHNWKNKLIKNIQNSYSKAPFYNEVNNIIGDIISYDESNLSKYLFNSIKQICKTLDIKTHIEPTSSKYLTDPLKKGQDKIIDICLKEKGSIYVNPIGGVDYYDSEKFKENNLSLKFLNTSPSPSIINDLMLLGIKKAREKINKYTLINDA